MLCLLLLLVLGPGAAFRWPSAGRLPGKAYPRDLSLAESAAVDERSGASSPTTSLTQKDYLIALRNRLFSVEEQLWLHEYAVSHPAGKVSPLSQAKYEELLVARNQILDEYPLTRLYVDMTDAQNRNLTYAAMFLDRLIGNFNRQVPLSLNHVNQIVVLSFSGQVVNLMRGQGSVYQVCTPPPPPLSSP